MASFDRAGAHLIGGGGKTYNVNSMLRTGYGTMLDLEHVMRGALANMDRCEELGSHQAPATEVSCPHPRSDLVQSRLRVNHPCETRQRCPGAATHQVTVIGDV